MKKFEFLDIAPADAAFAAYGKDLEEVFANSALALISIITDTSKVEDAEKKVVEARGYDLKSLMFDWLNHVLYISSTEHMLFSKFEVEIEEVKKGVEETDKEEDRFFLKGVCWGEKIDLKKHEMDSEVKAITYHKMEIEKKDGKWKAQVIVDL